MPRYSAFLVLVAVLIACTADSPWGVDPDAANIVPTAGADAAYVVVEADPGSHTPGVEGSLLFVRLIGSDGSIVLDRAFEWPNDEQAVPPGTYTLLAYWRVCEGHCGRLSGESESLCEDEVVLAQADRAVMHVIPSDLRPGSECTIDVRPP